ncbi:MAG TPA: glycosyl hydrolase family 28 protein, partial [Polyangiaceae bacterium]
TDGVDFDESTNGTLSNAFLYTGDDGMATKNEEPSGTINTKNITHQHIVVYNNSAGCKIGTKTMGQTMDNIVFKDIDLVKAGRGLVIDGADTAVVQNTTFQDVRIEAVDSSLVDVQNNNLPSWRTAAGMTVIKETFFTNVSADVRKSINLHGTSSSVNVIGVHFNNFTLQGKAVGQSDLSTNAFVSGITFQ